MLPAPARIAAPPRPKSRASWNPAVPPPPVAGAAVGNGLADGLGVADGLAEELALALGVMALAVPLDKIVGVAERVPPGENEVGVAEGEDAVQAETDTEASMVKVAQPMAVDLALSLIPAMVVCIFMDLLMRLAGGWPVSRSRHSEAGRGREIAWSARALPAPTRGRFQKASSAI
jgi:hypothetical protein